MELAKRDPFLDKAKEIACELWEEETDRKIVDAETSDDFEIEDKKYHIEITAYWESSRWGSYKVTGVDFAFEKIVDFFEF